jgi:hypothetical protein
MKTQFFDRTEAGNFLAENPASDANRDEEVRGLLAHTALHQPMES